MKQLTLIFVMCVGVAMSGCQAYTNYDFTLRNSTSATTVRFQSAEGRMGCIDTTLLPGAQLLLGDFFRNVVDEEPPRIEDLVPDILVMSAQGDAFLRDPNVNSTWTVATEDRHRHPNRYFHHYTLEIKDSDF